MVSRAKDTHTTNRVVRVDDDDWADYEQACKAKGVTRSADLRMHIKREVTAWRRANRREALEALAEKAKADREQADVGETVRQLRALVDELAALEAPDARVKQRVIREALDVAERRATES